MPLLLEVRHGPVDIPELVPMLDADGELCAALVRRASMICQALDLTTTYSWIRPTRVYAKGGRRLGCIVEAADSGEIRSVACESSLHLPRPLESDSAPPGEQSTALGRPGRIVAGGAVLHGDLPLDVVPVGVQPDERIFRHQLLPQEPWRNRGRAAREAACSPSGATGRLARNIPLCSRRLDRTVTPRSGADRLLWQLRQ